MAKRQANTVLNHDNWDQEEEAEDPGEFKRGSEDELKKRVIKKARRNPAAQLNKSTNSGSSSPFASFSGFGSTRPPTQGFSFLSNLANKSPDIPLKPQTTTSQSNLFQTSSSIFNNNSTSKPNSNFSLTPSPTPKDNNNMSEDDKNNIITKPNTVVTTQPDVKINPPSKKASPKVEETETSLMKELNECCLKWIQQHFDTDPHCDFTPVFTDYQKHVEDIRKRLSKESEEASKDKTIPTVTVEAAPAVDQPVSSTFNTLIKESSIFQQQSPPTATKSSFSFSTDLPKVPQFSSEKSFVFGSSASSAVGETKPFSFGLANPVVAPKKPEPSEDEPDDEPKEPEKAFVEEEALYSVKCKLFFKKDGNFLSQGVGNLFIKNLDGKKQLLIRTDNLLGKILFNIILSPSLPTQRMGTNNVMIMCVPFPAFEGTEGAIPVLLRVKDAPKADELLETINKYKDNN